MDSFGVSAVRNASFGRATGWSGITAALVAAALLATFWYVVSNGVRQGDLRRLAVATLNDATWRCNAEPTKPARQACLNLIGPAPRSQIVARREP